MLQPKEYVQDYQFNLCIENLRYFTYRNYATSEDVNPITLYKNIQILIYFQKAILQEKVLSEATAYTYWRYFMAKRVVAPDVCMYNDENCESLNIQVDLPGVKKEDIEFNFLGDGFYILAEAEDATFKGAFALPGPVDAEKALGGFSDGMLVVNVPYQKTSEKSIRLKID